MLGRKQNIKNEQDWLDAMANIEQTVSKDELDALIDRTVADIKEKTAGKKVAYSWSAGKDSLALQFVCEKAGIKDALFVYCDLEYPAFMEWVEAHKPEGCTMFNTKQNMEWLAKHQEMLFPQRADVAGKWFHIVQHTGQNEYYKDNNLDMILLGRRRQDGNYVGKGTNIYTNGKGVTRFSPICDWRHEDVMALIHYYGLEMPPIYSWKNGYLCGTHNWAERQWTGSIENGWREVYDIDKSIVVEASKYFPSAKKFLESIGE